MYKFLLGTVFGACLMSFVAMHYAKQADRWYVLYDDMQFDCMVWKEADLAHQQMICDIYQQVERLQSKQSTVVK